MKSNIFIVAILFFILFVFTQTLTFSKQSHKKTLTNNHQTTLQTNHQTLKIAGKHFMSLNLQKHLQDDDSTNLSLSDDKSDDYQLTDDQLTPIYKFMEWLKNDSSMKKSIDQETAFSEQDTKKVRDYIHEHPQIIITSIFDSSYSTRDCMSDMNDDQKRKLALIVIDHTDLSLLPTGQSGQYTDDQIQAMKKDAQNDDDLAQFADKCVNSIGNN